MMLDAPRVAELLIEPRFERPQEWPAFLLAYGTTLLPWIVFSIGSSAAMHTRASLAIGAVPPLATSKKAQRRPAESNRDRLSTGRIGKGLVGHVSVALHDAAIVREPFQCVHRAATGSVAVGDGRRIDPTPSAGRPGRWPRSIPCNLCAAQQTSPRRENDHPIAVAKDEHIAITPATSSFIN
jgi:hypothetical protein